jgi:hypothetical protein
MLAFISSISFLVLNFKIDVRLMAEVIRKNSQIILRQVLFIYSSSMTRRKR